MQSNGPRKRLRTIALGLAVLFVPAIIILTAVEVLILTGTLTLSELTPIVILELYLVELVVFAGGAYLLYRLLLSSMPDPVPDDTDRADDAGEDAPSSDRE